MPIFHNERFLLKDRIVDLNKSEKIIIYILCGQYPSITGLNLLLDDDLVKRYAEGASEDQVKKSVVKLNVFFKDLSFQKTTESQAMTTIGLFGYVGGILGKNLGLKNGLLEFYKFCYF